jgi:hypothetical protein
LLRAPYDEPVARQGTGGKNLAGTIHGVNLDHALGQIYPHANSFTSNASSCNLLQGTSPFNGLRLMTLNTTNLGASTPLPEAGKSLRIPFKRSPNGMAPGPRGSVVYHLPHGPGATLSVLA